VPETAALLDAMHGTPRLMALLIYGGGLRASECCELRVKDLDFDQGLVSVRSGKGDKDRSTLLAETGRDDLRAVVKDLPQPCEKSAGSPPRATARLKNDALHR
jgi:integrase